MTRRPGTDTRGTCPWPLCGKPFRPAYVMCRTHWYRLPAGLRTRITATYRRGQTILTASPEYLDALQEALSYAAREAGR